MIGLLCSQSKERQFAGYLRRNMDLRNHNISVIVFSMPNINLNDRTVFGTLISDGKATTIKAELPSLILNFAVQHTKSHIKKLKNLMEVENLTLINSVNSFNQWSIMKMLTSDNRTKQYVLPYANISKEDMPDIQNSGSCIIKPQNGSNITKTMYCRKTDHGHDVYNIGEIAYSHLFDIQSAVIPSIRSGKWILINAPEMITYNKKLLIIRGYLKRNNDGEWKVVLKAAASQTEKIYRKVDVKIDAALIQMMGYINCFISDLAFCAIDLVLSNDGTPYFLSLGGWQDLMPQKKKHKILSETLCQSIKAYAEYTETSKNIE